MRAFIVLCFVALACGEKSGYNYQPGASSSNNGLSFAPGSILSSPGGGIPSNGVSGYGGPSSIGGQSQLSNPIGGGSPLSGSGPGSAGQPSDGSASLSEPIGELEKEYYTFSANDDDFNDANANNQAVNSVKQGLRVVFIKGPDNKGLEDAVVNLAKQAAQQQTDIYVLNKQTDISDLANKLNSLGSNNHNKPEVHFVKYRTPEDAANAQKAIQDQYDSLGGPSQSINGGVAPVINFASQGPAIAAPSVNSPSNSYLPSSVLRRLRFRF